MEIFLVCWKTKLFIAASGNRELCRQKIQWFQYCGNYIDFFLRGFGKHLKSSISL